MKADPKGSLEYFGSVNGDLAEKKRAAAEHVNGNGVSKKMRVE